MISNEFNTFMYYVGKYLKINCKSCKASFSFHAKTAVMFQSMLRVRQS